MQLGRNSFIRCLSDCLYRSLNCSTVKDWTAKEEISLVQTVLCSNVLGTACSKIGSRRGKELPDSKESALQRCK